MKISVIVPFFNDELYIKHCIESIKSQLYCDLEVVLVDDCGNDNSSKVAIQAIGNDDRFKIIVHEKNKGLAAARNSGIREAVGDYVFFLDADDKLANNESLFELITLCDGCQMVLGDFIRSNGDVVSGANNFTNATNKLIDIQWLKSNDLYFIEGIIYEDVPWALKAYSITKKFVNSNKVTYFHNIRSGSISRSLFNNHKVESMLTVLKELNRLQKDDFIVNRIVYNSIFLLKNLLLGDFEDSYKRSKYQEIKSIGVLDLATNSNSIPKFSRLLYYVRKSYKLSSTLCFLYKKWKRC